MEELLQIPAWVKMPMCYACERAKLKMPQLPTATFKRTGKKFYLLHTDMSGYMEQASVEGAHYYLVFIDCFSNYKWVYLLKTKNALIICTGMAPDVIKTWEILQTDQEGEMCSDEAEKYYKLYRIFQESSNPHQHWQNPRSKNAIGELGVRTLVIMAHSGALGRYWGFAMFYTCNVDNMFLPYKAGSDKTCWEAWHCEPPTAVSCPT
eukprot:3934582-Rhodomonas_salina.2